MAINLKNKNKITRRKLYTIATLLTCLIVGSVSVYAISRPEENVNTAQEDKHSSSKKSEDIEHKDDNPSSTQLDSDNSQPPNDPQDKKHNTNTDTPPPIQESQGDGRSQVMMSIFYDTNSTSLNIRGGIDNAVVFEGQCYVKILGPNDEAITKDTQLLQNPRTTDCQTISIPLENLAKGLWTAQLHYESKAYEGKSDEVSIDIK